MRTKRRYAHELYPHADECEVRPLEVEVPYLYALTVGFSTYGTSWAKVDPAVRGARLELLTLVSQRALLADALLQGLSGQEAWDWAASQYCDFDSVVLWDRAHHYGVPADQIKPYPCGPEPQTHWHSIPSCVPGVFMSAPAAFPESECAECCEPEPTDG